MKVVAFDMEGTLFKPFTDGEGHESTSMWSEIPRKIGQEAEKEQKNLYEKWVNDEFESYLDFTRATVQMHDKVGIKKHHLEEVLDEAELRDGVHTVFETINEYQVATVLVTGSFKELAETAQEELGIDHVFASSEYFWSENGEFSHANTLPTDQKGKRRIVSAIAESYGVEPQDVIYVGDNNNDLEVLKWSGVSVGVNPPESLNNVLDYRIDTEKEKFSRIEDIIEKEFE